MSSPNTLQATELPSRSDRRARDPLQIPVQLECTEDRPLGRVLEATRELVLWLAIVFGAAIGIFFVGATLPELKAAAPDHPRETPAVAEPAPQPGKVREWYLPDVLFNDKAAVAQPIDTF